MIVSISPVAVAKKNIVPAVPVAEL